MKHDDGPRFSTDENPDGLDPARGLLNGTILGAICWALLIWGACSLTGCTSSWFQTRVEQGDAKIEVLERERKAATAEDERARIDEAIATEKADREASLQGALEEQKNKQALLMALIALGTGGLKMAAGVAAKGAL